MWISHIPEQDADGRLRTLYDRVAGPDGTVDNIMLAHSLRPHTMEGHMALYKSVLHHSANTLPKWFLETLGVYTSLLNHCDYCVAHHFAGLERLLGDVQQAAAIRHALERELFAEQFDAQHTAALEYARRLTLRPADVNAIQQDAAAMRAAGLHDGEILEVNQVVAYFNYANRTVLGLGITTAGDALGLSPNNSEQADDWTHR